MGNQGLGLASALDPNQTLEISWSSLVPTRCQLFLSRLPPINKRTDTFGEPLRFQLALIKREKGHKWRVRNPRMR